MNQLDNQEVLFTEIRGCIFFTFYYSHLWWS